jgi:hypothetical protein
MSGAAEALLVILSIFLGLFLLLAIILVIMLIRVTHRISKVAGDAERAVDSFGTVISGAAKVTSPALIVKLILNMIRRAQNKSNK